MKPDLQALLRAFCDEDDRGRWATDLPFRVGGRLYATDCRILISIPDSRRVKVSLSEPPKFRDIFATFRVCRCTLPLPPMRSDIHPDSHQWRSQKIGRNSFHGYYLAKIHEHLTGVKYDPNIQPWRPMFFIADGGVRGALMPRRPSVYVDELLDNPRGE